MIVVVAGGCLKFNNNRQIGSVQIFKLTKIREDLSEMIKRRSCNGRGLSLEFSRREASHRATFEDAAEGSVLKHEDTFHCVHLALTNNFTRVS